jgi:sRNA-binding carbon storage regulator CsrA
VFIVPKVLPSDEDELRTFVLVVKTLLLAVAIEAPRELDAERSRLSDPVIAESTEDIGLVKVSAITFPTEPGVVKVEVAAPHI